MRTFFLSAFLCILITGSACSGFTKSFCHVKSIRSNHFVICGVISGTVQNGIQMSVIDVLYGTESRTTITIWDGTDFICTGVWSMKASDMGKMGDTLIALLPMITTIENSWDVAGDYRRPYSLFETAWLNVKNDLVTGYIVFSGSGPMTKYPYQGFKTYWTSQGGQCLTLSVNDLDAEKIKVIVVDNEVTVQSISGNRLSVKLYSTDGRLLVNLPHEKEHKLDCSHLPTGFYILTISDSSGSSLKRKIVL